MENLEELEAFDVLENEVELAGTGDSLEFGVIGAIIDVIIK